MNSALSITFLSTQELLVVEPLRYVKSAVYLIRAQVKCVDMVSALLEDYAQAIRGLERT